MAKAKRDKAAGDATWIKPRSLAGKRRDLILVCCSVLNVNTEVFPRGTENHRPVMLAGDQKR